MRTLYSCDTRRNMIKRLGTGPLETKSLQEAEQIDEPTTINKAKPSGILKA